MKNLLISLMLVAVFTGCGTIPINNLPEGYAGETAEIRDSIRNINQYRSAHFFVLSKVDGTRISNSVGSSIRTGYNSGYILPVEDSRKVKPIKQNFTITAVSRAGVPAMEMFSGLEYVSEEVAFTPKAFKRYTVAGVVNNHYAAAWIEDEANQRVTEIVEAFDRSYKTEKQKSVIRERYVNGYHRTPSSDLSNEQYFSKLKSGVATAEDVTTKLGTPSTIKTGNWGFDYQDLTFANLGKLRFVNTRDSSLLINNASTITAASKYSIDMMKEQMEESDGTLLRHYAMDYHRSGVNDESYLDIIANKVAKERYNEGEDFPDAIAWLSKVLTQSGNGRYRSFLEGISQDNKVPKKIRKHIDRNIQNLPKGSSLPFKSQEDY